MLAASLGFALSVAFLFRPDTEDDQGSIHHARSTHSPTVEKGQAGVMGERGRDRLFK
jgi:hypothetical protein